MLRWVFNEDIIKNLVIHSTVSSIRRAIDSSVYKTFDEYPYFRLWWLKDEANSPLLPHVLLPDVVKYGLMIANQYLYVSPTEPPTEEPTEGPTEYPCKSYITWDYCKTGGPECECLIRGNMAIFNGKIAYYPVGWLGSGNYVGINIYPRVDIKKYPNVKVILKRTHDQINDVIYDINSFKYNHGVPYFNWITKVDQSGEEMRLLICWKGVDGGPGDPFTETVLIGITHESVLKTK